MIGKGVTNRFQDMKTRSKLFSASAWSVSLS